MKRLFAVFGVMLLFIACSSEPEKTPSPVAAEKTLLEELKERTVKNPKDAEAWIHLADLYDRDAMYQEEITALNNVIGADPDKKSIYLNLANTYSRLGRYQDAIANYQKAIHSFPRNPVLYNNLGVAYGKIGEIDEEIGSLKKAISLRTRYATARFNLGMALLKKGSRDLALQQYHELKTFDNGVAESLKKEIDAKGKQP
jgi:tetratricopeptide (TPR) repeat protein